MSKVEDGGIQRLLLTRVQAIAREIVAGTVEPRVGADKIHEDITETIGHPYALRAWCALCSGLDPTGDSFEELENEALAEKILNEAAHLSVLDGGCLERDIASGRRSWAGIKWAFNIRVKGPLLLLTSLAFQQLIPILHAVFRGPKGLGESRPHLLRLLLGVLSIFLRFAGVIILCLGIATLGFGLVKGRNVNSIWIVPIAFFLGYKLIGLGRRVGANTAAEAMTIGPDSPIVLYLRSFTVDQSDEGADINETIMFDTREEEVLASIFRLVGPFVALGDPDDTLTRYGAARVYIDAQDWKAHVKQLMAQARIVVLRVSDTPSFLWEAETAIRALPPDRVLFYFSQHLSQEDLWRLYSRLADKINHHLPDKLPAKIQENRFIHFDEAWRPVVFGSLPQATRTKIVFTRTISSIFTHHKWRTRLSQCLRPFSVAGKLVDPTRRLFSNQAVVFAAILAGPITAGIMMALNLRKVGSRWVSLAILPFSIAVAVSLILAMQWGWQELIRLETQFPWPSLRRLSSAWSFLACYVIISSAFSWAWMALGDILIRQHLALGGLKVRAWWSAILIAVGAVVWWLTVLWYLAPKVAEIVLNDLGLGKLFF